jgi:hypothetical protein
MSLISRWPWVLLSCKRQAASSTLDDSGHIR